MTDPRYDEQFRRGYDGPPIPPPVTTAQDSRESSARIPVAPIVTPTPTPTPIPIPIPSRPPVDEQVAVVAGAVTDQESEPIRRRNPWSIALLVGALVQFMVSGWLLQDYVTTSAVNGYAPGEQLKVFAEQQVSPALLTSGLIAVVAWLVIGAVNARSRT